MARFLLKRIIHLVIVLFGVATFIFLLLHLAPGDPAQNILGERATPEQVEEIRRQLGLDQPLHIQYGKFLGRLAQADLGTSVFLHRPVNQLIAGRLPNTLLLVFSSALIAGSIGVFLGVLAAVRKGSWVEYPASFLSFFGVSAPSFWIGIMLIMLFAVPVAWIPVMGASGYSWGEALSALLRGDASLVLDVLRYLLLPAVTNAFWMMALTMRLTRTSMLEELTSDYVRTGYAKGLRAWTVYLRHALRNAMLPVVTIMAVQFGSVLSGAVITETVFNWPGMGRLLVDAAFMRDFPVVQGVVVMTALLFALTNLIVDIGYSLLDPRIRLE